MLVQVLRVLTMLIEILWFVEKERQGSSRVKLADSRRETPVGLQEQLRKSFEEVRRGGGAGQPRALMPRAAG